ncbi:hypothetical protein KFL_003930090 [Klebsormidium nitens]|uniref:Uncharacterized protein n=1 Tax=Klebsormidium nitens TaxID=105231 RepID=A0A0U9HTI5_KLENI|nr:hypothetical protein KFL_003930090 [Klebsormidium nitens]|eukprot:GAQ88005.1 hypothetical protein KFL_003930090 [Klebsormidium nitens]
MFPCCSGMRCDTAGDRASPEQAERSLFLGALVAHMDTLRARMGGDWAAFADELHHRILPAVHGTGDVIIDVTSLQKMADGVREQCMAWPGPVRAWFDALAPKLRAAAAGIALPRGWREKQDLLNHFQQIERRLGRGEDLQRELKIAKASGESSPGFMEVALFFCTLRAPSGRRTPADFFGTARALAPSEGIVRVSLPDFDGVASKCRELPFGWTYSRKRATGNTSKSLEISACIVLDIEHFMRHVAAGAAPGGREATVFVHGFNSSFAWAALKMALYAYKMREHAIVLFSWPSFESVEEYGGDEAHAMWAVPHFVAFMKRLLTSYRLERVHVLAHSMGSRVALYGLARLIGWQAPRGAARARLGQLVLAAPDFDTGEFFDLQAELSQVVRELVQNLRALYELLSDNPCFDTEDFFDLQAELSEAVRKLLQDLRALFEPFFSNRSFDTGEFFAELSQVVERVTVYCSANDQALHVSASVHGGLPRLGHFSARALLSASRHVPLADNFDVIDATGFDKSVIGHTYVFTHTGVVENVCAVLRGAAAASRRATLRLERFEDAFRCWRFTGLAERPEKAEQENVESELCEEHKTS